MAKDTIQMKGKVVEVIQSGNYRVQLENNAIINATVSGKMRLHHIQILMGDKVQVELSPYDLTKGRIIRRE
jgi:translation initiation factor IF-1